MMMSQVMNLLLPSRPPLSAAATSSSPATRFSLSPIRTLSNSTYYCNGGRFTSCLFFPNNHNKQEQARKALESALGGKKKELENWDKEIKKREEAGGGGNGGGGGGWFKWFGGSNGDHFWQEAQQASLAVLCMVLVYLVLAKGDVMLAVVFNPLLFALRQPRNAFTSVKTLILQKIAPNANSSLGSTSGQDLYTRNSAKESVVKKWGSD